MNLPNKITLTRIFMIPVFMAVFFIDFPFHYGISAIVFVVASCTDFLDGYIARSKGLVTNLGKFLDPIADKVLVATAMVLLLSLQPLFALFSVSKTFIYVTVVICVCIILARELIISAFRQIAAANGIVMAAEKLGKYKTVFQDVALFILLLAVELPLNLATIFAWIGFVLFSMATFLTVWSGVAYIIKNKQVLKDQ